MPDVSFYFVLTKYSVTEFFSLIDYIYSYSFHVYLFISDNFSIIYKCIYSFVFKNWIYLVQTILLGAISYQLFYMYKLSNLV